MRISETLGVRKTLAGLLFGLAYACASFAISGFLLERTAFDPERSGESAGVILDDAELQKELVKFLVDNSATFVVPADAENPPREIERLRRLIVKVADHPDGEQLFAKIIRDSHARLIGDRDEPVEITGEMLVPIVRNEAAAAMPTIVLPVPEVTALSITNRVLDWLVPLLALAALLLAVVGFTSHPDKEALLKSLAWGLLLLAVLIAIVGYLVPKFLLPLVDKSVWSHLPAAMADDSIPLLIGMELLLIGGSLALMATSGLMSRRRRWSQPISTYRYSGDERRWS